MSRGPSPELSSRTFFLFHHAGDKLFVPTVNHHGLGFSRLRGHPEGPENCQPGAPDGGVGDDRRGFPRYPYNAVSAGLVDGAGCCCCLLLQYLIQSCARGGGRIVENMCYEIR